MVEDKLKLKDDQPVWILKNIKEVFQELYDHYRAVVNRNEYLEKENKSLKSEAYKDEELTKMKEKYDVMNSNYYRGFPITEEEHKRIQEWMDKIVGDGPDMKINHARFFYKFYPTPLGISGVVVDSKTGQEFEFQEIG